MQHSILQILCTLLHMRVTEMQVGKHVLVTCVVLI